MQSIENLLTANQEDFVSLKEDLTWGFATVMLIFILGGFSATIVWCFNYILCLWSFNF